MAVEPSLRNGCRLVNRQHIESEARNCHPQFGPKILHITGYCYRERLPCSQETPLADSRTNLLSSRHRSVHQPDGYTCRACSSSPRLNQVWTHCRPTDFYRTDESILARSRLNLCSLRSAESCAELISSTSRRITSWVPERGRAMESWRTAFEFIFFMLALVPAAKRSICVLPAAERR